MAWRLSLSAVLCLLLIAPAAAAEQPAAAPLTDQQREQLLAQRDRLMEQAGQLQKEGKPAEAMGPARQVLAIDRQLYGASHVEVAMALEWLARLAEAAGDFASAIPLREEEVEMGARLFGKDHWLVAEPRLALEHARLVMRLDPAARERLAAARQRMQEAAALQREARPGEAMAAVQEAMAIRKEILGENHPDYANCLNSLAMLHQALGQYAQAESAYRQSLEITRRLFGESHPRVATCLNNLASLYCCQDDYARAEPLYQQALAMRKSTLGERSPEYASTLNHLAGLYESLGDLRQAETLYRQALEIRRLWFGDKSLDTAGTLNDLATVYDSLGDYTRAEMLYRQAMEVRKEILGVKHPDYAASLGNLAGVYEALGDYSRAETLYRQACDIVREAYGERHPDYARTLSNLAGVYAAMADYTRAEPMYRQACDIWREAFGSKHMQLARGLNNLAMVYHAQGDYARAEPLYQESLQIRGEVLGRKHPDYALGLNNLAGLYDSQGDYARAEPLYRQAIDILKEAFGPMHPRVAMGLENLAGVYLAQGDYPRAQPLLSQSLDINLRTLQETYAALSERQQLGMMRSLRHTLDAYLSVTSAAAPEEAYRYVLAWKGTVFVRQWQAHLAAARPELAPLLAEIESTSGRLATLALSVPQPERRDEWNRQLSELSEKKERLEAELSRRSEEFRQEREAITPQQLQAVLPADVALVDFLQYTHCSPPAPAKKGVLQTERRLAAFVVRAGRPVRRVDLGPLATIADTIAEWRKTSGRGGQATAAAGKLKQLLWQPLEGDLEAAAIVLVSPDGVLSRFPLAALPGKKPESFLLDDVSLALIPVPRMLGQMLAKPPADRPAPPAGQEPSLLLVGDVDYDAPPAAAAPGAGPQPSVARQPLGRGPSFRFSPLGGSRSEILAVRDSFESAYAEGKVHMLRRQEATEAAFRRDVVGSRYVLVSTHGFFAPSELPSLWASTRGAQPAASERASPLPGQQPAMFHPGLLSGLALTGANTPPQPDRDDGILTAEEVASLNLSGVDLAVLSACETGLGEVAGGEGVLGLQRAFQVAGAATVVASLWKVDDQATRSLMERFCENLWTRKLGKLQALREAELWMIHEGPSRGLVIVDPEPQPGKPAHADPYYWAAFELSGDWR